METWFAPPERAETDELTDEIRIVSENPVVSGLLHSVGGLLAVLDGYRQIVAFNDNFLKMLGIDDPAQVLGLRPGEALQCIHAADEPGGCGTTRFCSTCGAAVSIVTSLGQDRPVERICALSAHRDGRQVDISLLVRSHPITVAGKRFLLIFLQDITGQQRMAALERTFFHDINNMLSMLVQSSELLVQSYPSELADIVYKTSLRLIREVGMQHAIARSEISTYKPSWYRYDAAEIMADLEAFFANHPAARGKHVVFPDDYPAVSLKTDISLLLRVLINMTINALEATPENGSVKVWVDAQDSGLSFYVWNSAVIPDEVCCRIFQRNFSTKEQDGRGFGTYSMKLFGEQILGGNVGFNTSAETGTVFRFYHPTGQAPENDK